MNAVHFSIVHLRKSFVNVASLDALINLWIDYPSSLLLLQTDYIFPKWQILDYSKLKEFADDNLEYDENGRKFLKRVENTVGKGGIAHNEQFLLFPQSFQKIYIAET